MRPKRHAVRERVEQGFGVNPLAKPLDRLIAVDRPTIFDLYSPQRCPDPLLRGQARTSPQPVGGYMETKNWGNTRRRQLFLAMMHNERAAYLPYRGFDLRYWLNKMGGMAGVW